MRNRSPSLSPVIQRRSKSSGGGAGGASSPTKLDQTRCLSPLVLATSDNDPLQDSNIEGAEKGGLKWGQRIPLEELKMSFRSLCFKLRWKFVICKTCKNKTIIYLSLLNGTAMPDEGKSTLKNLRRADEVIAWILMWLLTYLKTYLNSCLRKS